MDFSLESHGEKGENQQTAQKGTRTVYVKLPSEWRTLNVNLSGNVGVDILSIVCVLEQVNCKKPDNLSFMYIKLCNDGYIEIPILFKIGGVEHPFFFIYNDIEAKNFIAAKAYLEKHGFGEVFYASTVEVSKVKDVGNPLKTSGTFAKFFNVKKEGISQGLYALWWKSEKDVTFCKSRTKDLVMNMFEAFQDYETWFFGYLIQELNLSAKNQGFVRVELPAEERRIPLHGPEDTDLILAVSKEKGIRFLFPVEASIKYRERLLKLILEYVQGLRMMLEARNSEKDEQIERPMHWYSFICDHVESLETSENSEESIEQICAVKIG